jgi:hypothetical protein
MLTRFNSQNLVKRRKLESKEIGIMANYLLFDQRNGNILVLLESLRLRARKYHIFF